MVTKDELEKDKAGLEKQRDQLVAELNAVLGALKYVSDKLEVIEEKENNDE